MLGIQLVSKRQVNGVSGKYNQAIKHVKSCMMSLLKHNLVDIITLTSPCNEDPLTPLFYVVKLAFTGVYIILLSLRENINCGYSLEPRHKMTKQIPQ